MKCIYCSGKLSVSNSRPQKKLNQVWRRRNCSECGAVMTSVEAIDLGKAITFQNGTHTEPFSRDTLLISIYESSKHRKTALSDALALTDTVIARLLPKVEVATLSRQQIIETTTETLKNFDKAASVHYAAYHSL